MRCIRGAGQINVSTLLLLLCLTDCCLTAAAAPRRSAARQLLGACPRVAVRRQRGTAALRAKCASVVLSAF